jgi:hypothetical protein
MGWFTSKVLHWRALDRDGTARSLTAWRDCQVLGVDELFVLNTMDPGLFDSRYFRPIDASFVRGRDPLGDEEASISMRHHVRLFDAFRARVVQQLCMQSRTRLCRPLPAIPENSRPIRTATR